MSPPTHVSAVSCAIHANQSPHSSPSVRLMQNFLLSGVCGRWLLRIDGIREPLPVSSLRAGDVRRERHIWRAARPKPRSPPNASMPASSPLRTNRPSCCAHNTCAPMQVYDQMRWRSSDGRSSHAVPASEDVQEPVITHDGVHNRCTMSTLMHNLLRNQTLIKSEGDNADW
jgi:hypothetical protein